MERGIHTPGPLEGTIDGALHIQTPSRAEHGPEGVLIFSLFLLLAALLPSPAYAQEKMWKELNTKLRTLYQQGRYAEAAKVAKEALKVAEATFGPDHPDVGVSLNNLALMYKAQGKYAEAEPLYKRELVLYQKTLGPEHPDMPKVLENMAELYKKTGREDEARKFEERAKAIRSRNK